jgi:hypothetical protein
MNQHVLPLSLGLGLHFPISSLTVRLLLYLRRKGNMGKGKAKKLSTTTDEIINIDET